MYMFRILKRRHGFGVKIWHSIWLYPFYPDGSPSQSQPLERHEHPDHHDAFVSHIGREMAKLDEARQKMAKKEIDQVLTQVLTQKLNNKQFLS